MSDWIGIVFDVVMLSAIAGMWVLWWRTSRKQRAIEAMLLEAARELEVATARLGESLEYIRRLKQERERPAPRPARQEKQAPSPPPKRAARRRVVDEEAPAKASSASGHITQILRMRREGKDIDAIAESLKLPKAQVKLLLKLHAADSR